MRLSTNLVRAYGAPDAVSIRSDAQGAAGDGNTLVGHFAVFNSWTKIDNSYEGRFMERIAPSAFTRALADPKRVKVLFDHGADPTVGSKPLGVVSSLKADARGVAYEVPLFDASYVNDLKPAIKAGAMGASFRFSVAQGGDSWVDSPGRSDHNPDGLPERTLTDVNLFEFGPVVFPAYADATAGMRSMTPDFLDRLATDDNARRMLAGRLGPNVVSKMLAARGTIVVVTSDDDDAEGAEDVADGDGSMSCPTCGCIYDLTIATVCPVCGTPSAGDASVSVGQAMPPDGLVVSDSSMTPDGPRGMSLLSATHGLILARRNLA